MLDQQEETIRARISQLKTYLHNINQQIQNRQKQTSPLQLLQSPNKIYPAVSTIQQRQSTSKKVILSLKIETLRKQIKTKTDLLCGIGNKTQKILHHSNKSIPTHVRIYKSRLTAIDNLQRVIKLLHDSDWDRSGIYMGKLSMIIVGSTSIEAHRVNLEQIVCTSVQLYKNYIKFLVQQKDSMFYILEFKSLDQSQLWHKFISQVIQTLKNNNNSLKWKQTKIKCKKSEQQQFFRKKNYTMFANIVNTSSEESQKNKNNSSQASKVLKEKNLRKLSKSTQKKYSLPTNSIFKLKKISIRQSQMQRSDSFVISNSSEGKVNLKPDTIKITEQQLVQSIRFQTTNIQQKHRNSREPPKLQKSSILRSQGNDSINNQIDIMELNGSADQLMMTRKVMSKLQQKRKLLAESSLTRLNIHWHEDGEDKHVMLLPSNVSDSPQKTKQLTESNQSTNKMNELTTKRDSSESPTRYKRIESATNDKSNSRQEESEAQNKRKKTDYSLQSESERRRSRLEIRDHYLQRLIMKQAIKQSSKSSNDNISSRKESNNLITIPQKQTPSASRYGSYRLDGQISIQQSSTHSLDSRQSTEQQIQAQQLKNGIVLEKCSKNSWGTKQKKLYISSTMSQLCYCDIQNPQEEKRFFLRDVKSIQYGKISRGILKHKKRYDQTRCLLIRINKQEKQKILQFYLEDSQPVYNLQQFAKKLKDFIQRQGQRQENQQD